MEPLTLDKHMYTVIKRNKKTETFDPKKVYASVYAACSIIKMTDNEAELISERVSEGIKVWLSVHKEVTAAQLQHAVARELKKYHPEAGYIYQHHRNIC